MQNKLGVVLAVVLFMVSRPMLAHHAGILYDREHPVTYTGTITDFTFINPHSQIHFDVKDEQGNITKWTAETGPPAVLHRAGWSRNSLKPGDQITITGFPRKDGIKEMGLGKLVAPTGQVLVGMGAQQ